MPRALWSGSIAFGLVSAPVRMYSAIDEHDLELHLVHRKDGSRIGYEKICKAEEKPVPDDEIVKAYELDGELVYLEDEDFDAAESDGYKTIEILAFVDSGEIDPIYFERSFFLGPQEGGEKVYALLVKALERAGLVGVVRYVFHDRERLGALRVRDGVLLLARMHYGDEIRPSDEIPPSRVRVERELELALELISRFSGDFEPDSYEDRYRERLLAIVKEKRSGGETKRAPAREPEETPDLLEALRQSVERHRGNGRSGNGSSGGPAEGDGDVSELTVEQLNELARELDIAGRSKMTKRQLVSAIRKAEAR
jgi:DNA end-binding protein Ku